MGEGGGGLLINGGFWPLQNLCCYIISSAHFNHWKIISTCTDFYPSNFLPLNIRSKNSIFDWISKLCLIRQYLFCFACKQNKLLWDQYIIGWFFICIQLNILKKMLEVHFPVIIWKPIIKHFPLILPAMGALGRDTKLSKH